MNKQTVKITEIFLSLQGETDRVGLPTVFIRLSGCPLRCLWCDTEYAFSGGTVMSVDDIVDKAKSYNTKFVTVTGGEPLAQETSLHLLKSLADAGFSISLETGGMIDIAKVDPRVCVILDIKTPSSNEDSKNLWSNLELLKPTDQVKFVIGDKADYNWSKDKLKLITKTDIILFSPVFEKLAPTELAEWILEDGILVRFQLQLHKILWKNSQGK